MPSKSISARSIGSFQDINLTPTGNITQPLHLERYRAIVLKTPVAYGDSFQVKYKNLKFGRNLSGPPIEMPYGCVWLSPANYDGHLCVIGPYQLTTYYPRENFVQVSNGGDLSPLIPLDFGSDEEITIDGTVVFHDNPDPMFRFVSFEITYTIRGVQHTSPEWPFASMPTEAYAGMADLALEPPFLLHVGWPPTFVLSYLNGQILPIYTSANEPGINEGIIITAASVTPA